MPSVTVVPGDRLIIVDGEAIVFESPFSVQPHGPGEMHALQWNGTSGHIEWEDDYNWVLEAEAYEEEVAPYVALWQAEAARREKVAAEAEAARLAEYNSSAARFERLRAERDRRIAATDYLLMPDYPLAENSRAAVQSYRQALRDLPTQEGWIRGWPGHGGRRCRRSSGRLPCR